MITDLTFVERTTLLVLMAESRPVKNTELPNLGSALGGPSRTKLNHLGLITSYKEGRGFVHELTDKGWVRASEEIGAEPLTAATRSGGKVLYTLMRAMRRYFDRKGIEPNEVFLPAPDASADAETVEVEATADSAVQLATVSPEPDDIEKTVVSTYHRLASEPNAWVSLTRLRVALPSVEREQVDHALTSLYRGQHINLIPEANQRELTTDDRDAALHIGGQSRHMMKIDR